MMTYRPIGDGFHMSNDREQDITNLAKWLLGYDMRNRLDEATIDAEFLFRFDPRWCRWVDKIRSNIRVLLGQTGEAPLSLEDGEKWFHHMEVNRGLTVDLATDRVSTHRGGYISLNGPREPSALLDDPLFQAARKGDKDEVDRLRAEIWMEANQTSKILSELERLAQAYGLIPIADDEFRQYSNIEFERMYYDVIGWVLWQNCVPSFRWAITELKRSKTGKGVKKFILPHRWSGAPQRKPSNNRGQNDVRIRTWSIYYLSRQGGGQLIEEDAIKVWNGLFQEYSLEYKSNYQSQLSNIFDRGSTKKP